MTLELRPYQVKGVEHLLSMPFGKPHSLLADEPGTGKTIMAIEAAKAANCKTGLILGPAIIKEQWKREMVKWKLEDEDAIATVYGTRATIGKEPWQIINYDLIREPEIQKQLRERKWHVLVMDEAHRLKTHTSKQSLAVFHKKTGIGHSAYYKWALSGSIVPNRPVELFPMLYTMAQDCIAPYTTYIDYCRHFCGGELAMGRGATNVDELTARIQPFMLRRILDDVWAECPPIIENEVWLDVPYKLHPEYIFCEHDSQERRIVAESKIPQAVAYLKQRLQDSDHKITVFSYHRAVIEGIAKGLEEFNPAIIYGGLSLKNRDAAKLNFVENPHCRVILLQINSAGEGLDGLQYASAECVEVEPEWSPGREDQAIRRLRRLGQTRPVIWTKLLAIDSYEERIFGSNLRKRKVIDVIQKPNGGTFIVSIEKDLSTIAKNSERIAIALEALANSGGVSVPSNVVPFTGAAQSATNQVAAAAPAAELAQTATPTAATASPSSPLANEIPVNPFAAQAAGVVQQPTAATPAVPQQQAAIAAGTPQPMPGGTVPGANISKEDFEKAVLDHFRPKGQAGFAQLQQLNTQFGVAKLGDLPASQYSGYLALLPA